MAVIFLTGPAGTGKTTQAVARLRDLLASQVPGHNILVIVPQLTLAHPYRMALRDPDLPGSSSVDVLTLNGLAMKTIELFWPLGAASGGFKRPHHSPIFLTIETAQYYLRRAIDPLLREGYFDPNVVTSLTISLPRLMSQILDNLNKAALIGLPHTQVGGRLAASLALEPGGRVALEHTQACVNRFREYCLARNLLDFSLRIELFYQHLWPVTGVRRFLTGRYRHLIVDNIEEDTPFAHAVLRDWLPQAESALLVNDEDAGYRIFLGANWRTAQALAGLSDQPVRQTASLVAPPEMQALGHQFASLLQYQPVSEAQDVFQSDHPLSPTAKIENRKSKIEKTDPRRVFTFEQQRFYPQMVDWVVSRIAGLVAAGTPPAEIVVLAPFVSDALRFSFTNRMAQRGLAVRSHRPSRPLSEEPAAKTMLTLARLAFPQWGLLPEPFDVSQAFSQAIAGLDLIRASLLTQVVYRPADPEPLPLTGFDQIEAPMRERISYEAGDRFNRLRAWLALLSDSAAEPPVLDHFFSRLFGELLSEQGFGFHDDQEAGQIVANLIDSARQFRRVAEQVPESASNGILPSVDRLNRAYLETIEEGIAAAQYIRSWEISPDEAADAVLITPATTFLMRNRPVDVQFWLDAGSSGWWERIAQPLTHPYLLAADWEPGRPWTDADEVAAQHDRLARLVLGLTRRCRKHVFIVNSEISEQGYEQRGQLLLVLQRMLRRLQL